MKTWQVYVLTCFIAVLAGAGGYYLHQQTVQIDSDTEQPALPPEPEQLIGKLLPEFELNDINGALRNSSEWQGKILAINFWATWCPPCREEIPMFINMQNQYADQGLQFIGVALHTAEEIQDFVKEFKVNYPSLVGINDVISLGKQLGNDIGALPYTVIVDRQGIIRFTHRGPLKRPEIEEVVASLL